eukprot:TRINITY_DN128309_c1_g1_i1.p1 TRINITY_DN128309_c1_g1~~TRINITY_DN128309_c1_g1_i1.p1  ORF type:complete len:266 (+),score=50.98 TRINITY_DN128309_c1_g1_i1:123-920(+)
MENTIEGFIDFVNYFGPSGKLFGHISIINLLIGFIVCGEYKRSLDSKRTWLESLISCFVLKFAGPSMMAWMFGQAPAWMCTDICFNAVFISWYLTFYCPFNLWTKIYNLRIVQFGFKLFMCIAKAHLATNFSLKFILNHPLIHEGIKGNWFPLIVGGLVSGCGSGIIASALNIKSDCWSFNKTPSVLKNPKLMEETLWNVIISYVLSNPHGHFAFESFEWSSIVAILTCVNLLNMVLQRWFTSYGVLTTIWLKLVVWTSMKRLSI